MQPVLEHLDLLADRLVLLLGRVVSTHIAPLGENTLAHNTRARIELLGPPFLHLDRTRNLVSGILHLGHFDRCH